MIIRLLPHGSPFLLAENPTTHVVTFAEPGFSPLTSYLREEGWTADAVVRFADEVNRRDEPGCLAPRHRLSAVPRRLIRDASGTIEDELALARQVETVLKANRESDLLRSRRLLFDFCSPDVPPWVLQGVIRAILANDDGLVEEHMLVDPARRTPSFGGFPEQQP